MIILSFVLVSVFVNLTQSRVSGEKGTSVEKMLSSDWPVEMSVGIFMINDGCGRAEPSVGGGHSLTGGPELH